jgi:2-methylisocitrate lyase-like PEP mutase family enzyme
MTDLTAAAQRAERFLALHRPGDPLLLPNPWDAGSAKVLASLGFAALATTSSGFAATLGRPDGAVSGQEALAGAAAIAAAVSLPVSADLENGYADRPQDVAATVTVAAATGLAGCSIEDYSGRTDSLYPVAQAADRIAAAAQAAHAGQVRLVLTARAENYLRGNPDLADTIARLQRYQEAGADVLYAPGLTSAADIRAVVSSVDLPVNVLAMPAAPPAAELAELGVARISVGGSFALAALAALAEAARELQAGTFTGYARHAAAGRTLTATAFAANELTGLPGSGAGPARSG